MRISKQTNYIELDTSGVKGELKYSSLRGGSFTITTNSKVTLRGLTPVSTGLKIKSFHPLEFQIGPTGQTIELIPILKITAINGLPLYNPIEIIQPDDTKDIVLTFNNSGSPIHLQEGEQVAQGTIEFVYKPTNI